MKRHKVVKRLARELSVSVPACTWALSLATWEKVAGVLVANHPCLLDEPKDVA